MARSTSAVRRRTPQEKGFELVANGTVKSSSRTSIANFSWSDQVTLVWFLLDAFTHLSIEALYLYFATMVPGGAKASSSPLAFIWKEYGKADERWMEPMDPSVISVEIPTVLLMGPCALLCAYGTLYGRPWRHLLVTFVCVIELIGGWYTFAPEWIAGSPKLHTDNPVHLWVYLFFMNALWVLIPVILLVDSSKRIVAACAQAGIEGPKAKSSIGSWPWTLSAAAMVVYCVAVPAVIVFAK